MSDNTAKWYERVDNYRQTLNVTIVFGHEMIWDNANKCVLPGAQFWSGKTMPTAPDANGLSRKKELTPDITAFISQQYGVVGEIKHGLPQDQRHWEKTIKQLASYDTALENWSDAIATVSTHDVVLLIPNYLRKKFEKYYLDKSHAELFSFVRKFSAVSYHMEQNAKLFITFEKFIGQITIPIKDTLLEDIHRVPADLVLPLYPMSFCNQPPPLPYAMERVWAHIGSCRSIEIEDETVYEFGFEELLGEMRKLNTFGGQTQGGPTLPKRGWIYDALEALKKLKLVTKTEDARYRVNCNRWRRLKKPLDTFIEKLAAEKSKTEKNSPMLAMMVDKQA